MPKKKKREKSSMKRYFQVLQNCQFRINFNVFKYHIVKYEDEDTIACGLNLHSQGIVERKRKYVKGKRTNIVERDINNETITI